MCILVLPSVLLFHPISTPMRLFPCRLAPPCIVALLLLTGLPAGCTAPPPAPDTAHEAAAIRAVLQAQVDAWNRGDIAGFMDGYVRSDSLRFASGNRTLYGWQATLERYQRSYPDRAAMGTLTFDSLDVRVLAPEWATVFGHWHLARTDTLGDLGGLFTLLLQKRPEGWRVLTDHTSG